MPVGRTRIDEEIAAEIVRGPMNNIADQIASAIAVERERCAKILDHYAQSNLRWTAKQACIGIAKQIRSGQTFLLTGN